MSLTAAKVSTDSSFAEYVEDKHSFIFGQIFDSMDDLI